MASTASRPAMHERIRDRRRDVDRQRLRRRRRRLLSLVAAVALAVGATAVARSPLFDIDGVTVEGASEERAREAIKAAAVTPGDNLLTADLSAARRRVAELPWVRTADTRRAPPSTVVLEVVPRSPVAVVRVPGAAWLVDGEGVVVEGGERDGLVEIDAPNSALPGLGGQVTDEALRNALAVHDQLPGPLRAAVDGYEAPSDRGLRIHLDNGVVVRFGLAERVPAKARTIGLLLEQVRTQTGPDGGEAGAAELDVRAPDNPVLVPAAPADDPPP